MAENSETSDGLSEAVQGVSIPEPSPTTGDGAGLFKDAPPDREVFDARIHQSNADGTPSLKKDGTFRKKYQKRNKAGEPYSESPIVGDEDPAKRRASAGVCVSMLLTLFRGVGGEEWSAEPGEREEMIDAFDAYFAASGTWDLPPGMILCVVVGSFAIRRFDRPQTKAKIAVLLGKFNRKKTIASRIVDHEKAVG